MLVPGRRDLQPFSLNVFGEYQTKDFTLAPSGAA